MKAKMGIKIFDSTARFDPKKSLLAERCFIPAYADDCPAVICERLAVVLN